MGERRHHGGVVALALALAALMAATAAAATLTWGRPQPLHALPASAPNNDLAGLTALACQSLRSCAAVGDFGYDLHTEPATSVTQGEALNESAGVWGRARQIRLPANAASVGNQHAVLNAVACPAAGSCVAVGDYNDRAGVSEAMVVTESAGTWGQAREIAVPSTGGGELDSVSCPAPGACAAVGYYGDGSSRAYPLAVSESGGTWGAAREVIVPVNDSAPGADGLSSVSCPAPGACTAVGYAGGSQGSNASASEMIAAGESGGVWGRAQTIALSPTLHDEPGPQDELYGVACAAARSCVAVGQFQSFPPSTSFGVEQAAGAHDSDLSQTSDAIVATESDGTWGVATRITPPPGAASGQDTGLDSVSCPRQRVCVAVGQYDARGGNELAMSAQESGGRWGPAAKVTLPVVNPSGIKGAGVYQGLGSLTCPAPGLCDALDGNSVVSTG